METYLAYFDETGDDGATMASSDLFVLTSIYMAAKDWQENFETIRSCRAELKEKFGLHVSEEFHTRYFVRNKGNYRDYGWTEEQQREILIAMTKCIASLKLKIINVIIDKNHIKEEGCPVLENALTYNIQRIENDSRGAWNYLIFSDKGRIGPMRKTARAIRAFNPVQSRYGGILNRPIRGLLEDIVEKDSKESYFIQICDFVSYFVHLYYKCAIQKATLPKRVERVADAVFVKRVMATLKYGGVLNLRASAENEYGLVIYPK